jgi:hypothetical protein
LTTSAGLAENVLIEFSRLALLALL